MMNLSTLTTILTGTTLIAAITSAMPVQAITINFEWNGDNGYLAQGSFDYDETTAPTIISESGSGATNFLQSLTVSFFDPSNSLLGTYNTVEAGVSQSSFFAFNFDTSSQTLFGPFNVGGGTGVIGELFFFGTIGSSLELRQDVDQQGASTLLDQNNGSIQIVQTPESSSSVGLLTLCALGVGATFKLKLKQQSKNKA